MIVTKTHEIWLDGGDHVLGTVDAEWLVTDSEEHLQRIVGLDIVAAKLLRILLSTCKPTQADIDDARAAQRGFSHAAE
jgi:hypothetical protein